MHDLHEARVLDDSNNISAFDENNFNICDDDCEECANKRRGNQGKVFSKLKKSGLIDKWNKSVERSRKSQGAGAGGTSVGQSFLVSLNDEELKVLNESLTFENVDRYDQLVQTSKRKKIESKRSKIVENDENTNPNQTRVYDEIIDLETLRKSQQKISPNFGVDKKQEDNLSKSLKRLSISKEKSKSVVLQSSSSAGSKKRASPDFEK